MTHYLIELAIWMLGFFFTGCCIGCLLNKLFGADEAPAVAAASTAAAVAAPLVRQPAPPPPPPPVRPVVAERPVAPPPPPPAPVISPAPAAEPMALSGKMERPRGIAAARGGKADNLQRISGVGPKNEKILHTLGFFHFDQIAAWTSEQVNWVDDHLKFNGRIRREEWIKQARLLAEGKEQEFLKLYGTGGLRNRRGETLSGTRTRKS
jgi:predicted flap endonuclease-1-like 5' DNA nuclease